MKIRKHERGQAIILIVIGLVVLMGFVGFAIDGGRVLGDRRHAQNAADAASLAAGGQASLWLEDHAVNYANWTCDPSIRPATYNEILEARRLAREAAVSSAGMNGFTIDMDITDDHGVGTTCESYNYGSYVDRYIDITVKLTTQTPTTFASLLFPNDLTSITQSVVRVRPRQPLVFGNAIVALNAAACSGQRNGISFHGNVDVKIDGGGIFSNGCLRANGNIDVDVDGPAPGLVQYVGQVIGENKFSDPVTKALSNLPPDSYFISKPNCDNEDAVHMTGGELLSAGFLDPGLYCISGDLRINGNDTLRGNEITIVMLDGEIRINGNATVQITAPPYNPDPSPAVPGLLIYMEPGNDNNVQINGNSTSFFTGTVYAPESDVNLLGNGTVNAYKTQIIGWNVEAGGTNDTNVVFNQKINYTKPTTMDLNR